MIGVYPEFFFDFKCIADKCRHTCCAGWEIDVDDDTADYYRQNETVIGKNYSDVILRDEEGAHFILTEDERCPFLQADGLCRIIKTLGEDALCDICTLHPRFYEEYEGLELNGLGLSCEAVCDLLWETEEPLKFFTDSGEKFHFPLQDISFTPDISEGRILRLLTVFAETEPIDDNWIGEVGELLSDMDELLGKAAAYESSYDTGRFNRLFHYIAYRQLERDLSDEVLSRYATDATLFIFLLAAAGRDEKDAIRRFSEQIEYSTENVDHLINSQGT